MLFPERLDLDVHARGKLQLHQRVHRLLRRFENIEQTLMSADLELLARLLVHVRGAQYGVLVLHRRQRNRPCDLCARAASGVYDLAGGLVENAIVVSFQADPDSFFANHVSYLSKIFLLGPACVSASRPAAYAAVIGCPTHSSFWNGWDRNYAMISEIVPAPTVRPPSRIAKRKPFSMATGVISSISSATLSPGITISVPAGNVATPVTSVVRK